MSERDHIFFIVLLLTTLILGGWIYLLTLRRKDDLKSVSTEFGNNVIIKAGISSFEIQFERDGTVFKGSSATTRNSTAIRINFHLPRFDEKFLIRQNSSLAAFHAWMDEGQFSPEVSIPGLPDNYIVLSPNPDFTKTLLAKVEVLAEIASLDDAFRYPQVWFENGQFQIELFSESGWDIVKKINRVCRAAVVFHDGIKTLSVTD